MNQRLFSYIFYGLSDPEEVGYRLNRNITTCMDQLHGSQQYGSISDRQRFDVPSSVNWMPVGSPLDMYGPEVLPSGLRPSLPFTAPLLLSTNSERCFGDLRCSSQTPSGLTCRIHLQRSCSESISAWVQSTLTVYPSVVRLTSYQ